MRPSRSAHVSLPTTMTAGELPLANLPAYDEGLGGFTASVQKPGVPEPTAWKITVMDGELEWYFDDDLPGGKRPLTDEEIENRADWTYNTETTGSDALVWKTFAESDPFASCRVRYAVGAVWTHYGPCLKR